MELYYHVCANGNFGDDLNLWLWDGILPGWREWDPDRVLIGVGTLLSSTFIKREGSRRRYLVAGTGVGYGDGRLPSVKDTSRWDVRSVRGPHSAHSLGLRPEFGVGDPAMMLATLPEFVGLKGTGRSAFVPHESTVDRHDWSAICAELGIDFVSPRDDARKVIASIASSSLVLTEAMHGAIVADTFRVPWIPVRIGHRFLASKWRDWAASLDVDLTCIPPLFPAEDRLFAFSRSVRDKLPGFRRGRSARVSASQPSWDAGAPRPSPGQRVQARVESMHLASALRGHLKRRPILSAAHKLASQMDRYQGILHGIRRDYG